MNARHAIIGMCPFGMAVAISWAGIPPEEPKLRPAASVTALGEILPEERPQVPARFQGEWSEKHENCGTGIDHARFRIEADRIAYYESSGAIVAAVARGASELAVIADMSGEGLEWLGLMHFRLSEDQACLTELTASDAATGRQAGLVRCRCPSRTP